MQNDSPVGPGQIRRETRVPAVNLGALLVTLWTCRPSRCALHTKPNLSGSDRNLFDDELVCVQQQMTKVDCLHHPILA